MYVLTKVYISGRPWPTATKWSMVIQITSLYGSSSCVKSSGFTRCTLDRKCIPCDKSGVIGVHGDLSLPYETMIISQVLSNLNSDQSVVNTNKNLGT